MHKASAGSTLRDIILGGQDGLVNVLGIVLAVAGATSDTAVVLVAGIAATFAESISMGAVAYTSVKAEREYYERKYEEEKRAIEETPEEERREIREIYAEKGFKGAALANIVSTITRNKKVWLNVMMSEELSLPDKKESPLRSALVVGGSSFAGSVIPLIPFVLMPVSSAMYASVALSLVVLFAAGAIKTRVTVGTWWKSGLEMAAIGTLAALAGFVIGNALGVAV